LVRGNEGVEKQLTPEEQALVNAERLNWKNWSIDSVERKSSLTWCVKRSKTIVFEDGKTKELKNEEYTDALDGKAQEWWESKNGKHEKVIQLSKDDIPLVRKQMEPQEEPLIWGFDDLEYDDDSPMPRPRRREMPAHRNPTGQGW
jgi:NACalpha-BTF3-like transcription factor